MPVDKLAILIGGTDLTNMNDCFFVSRKFVHPKFNPEEAHFTSNIAILKLDYPIKFAEVGPKLVL